MNILRALESTLILMSAPDQTALMWKLAGVEAIVTDAERERAASDEQLLIEVAKVLANDNQDAERLRALLKLFAA